MEKKTPDFAAIISLTEEHEAEFRAFYRLLSAYNRQYNLTAIEEEEEVLHKHFYDSLAGVGFFPQGTDAVEIGSGAGFPSIPLKIVRPDLTLTLVESTEKKCAFLRAAVRELALSGVEIVHARAEELGRDSAYREKFSAAFARAVAPLPTLLEYCLPLVKEGGFFLAYKGAADERAEGERAIRTLGGAFSERISYALPHGYGERSLIYVKKCKKTPAKYPRGHGKERTAPIV